MIGSNPNLFPDEGKRGENTGPCERSLSVYVCGYQGGYAAPSLAVVLVCRSLRSGLRSDMDIPGRDGRSRRLRVVNCTRRGELRIWLLLVTVLPLVILLASDTKSAAAAAVVVVVVVVVVSLAQI